MSFTGRFARTFVLGALLALAGAAQAIVYDLNYDPEQFAGFGQLTISAGCLDREDGTYSSSSEGCQIDLLFDQTHDSGGGDWSLGFTQNIATSFSVRDSELVGFDSILFLNFAEGFSDFARISQSCDASGQLQFLIPGNVVNFQGCGGLDTTNYTLSRADEPAPAFLALGGLGAVWFARRRRRGANAVS
jgi:MYXO-CTERM domain-containing protein